MRDVLRVKAMVEATLEDPSTGKPISTVRGKNLVTTLGFQELFTRILDPSIQDWHLRRFPSQVLLGTDSTPPVIGQTDLLARIGAATGGLFQSSNPDSGVDATDDWKGFVFGVDKWERPSATQLKMTKLYPAGNATDNVNNAVIREYGLFGPMGFKTGKSNVQGFNTGGTEGTNVLHRKAPVIMNAHIQGSVSGLEDQLQTTFYVVRQGWLNQGKLAAWGTDTFPVGTQDEDVPLMRQVPHRVLSSWVAIPPFVSANADAHEFMWNSMMNQPFIKGDDWVQDGSKRHVIHLRQDPVGSERGYQLVRIAGTGQGVWRTVNSLGQAVLDTRADKINDLRTLATPKLDRLTDVEEKFNVPVFHAEFFCQNRNVDFLTDGTRIKPDLISRAVLPAVTKTAANQLRVVWTWDFSSA